MFRCYNCQKVTPVGTPAHRQVIEYREKTYTSRVGEKERRSGGKKYGRTDQGGRGKEIVREVMLCPECARRFEQESAAAL